MFESGGDRLTADQVILVLTNVVMPRFGYWDRPNEEKPW